LQKLPANSEGFSGAEIEQAIAAELYTAFAQKQQLTTKVLLEDIHSTQPISVTAPKKWPSFANGPRPAPLQQTDSAPPHRAYQYRIAAHLVFPIEHIAYRRLTWPLKPQKLSASIP
jgi:hypothetical protein